ncbi:hypothetical protein B0H11DRAFT_1903768 [Mycena galericulata]|nr:hypothetical protein B0H11DRAFT_1903768 [Mycena galericulata]
MKTSRQAQDTVRGHIEVELVGITTPAPEQLNFEVSITGNGSCRSSATTETVTRVTRLVKTDGGDAGFKGANEFCTAKGRRIGFCKEGGGGREGMDGKEVLHCADWTGGWGVRCGSDDDGDTAAERVSLRGGNSELHILNTTFHKEPNRVARKVDSAVKLGTITDGETCPSQILSRIKDGVVNVRKVASDESETEEDVKRDGKFGLTIPVALKTFDAPNHTLQCGGAAGLERKTCIDMEGTNTGEVALNGSMEDGTILAGEMSRPGHESDFCGWKELPGSERMLRVEPDEIEE